MVEGVAISIGSILELIEITDNEEERKKTLKKKTQIGLNQQKTNKQTT